MKKIILIIILSMFFTSLNIGNSFATNYNIENYDDYNDYEDYEEEDDYNEEEYEVEEVSFWKDPIKFIFTSILGNIVDCLNGIIDFNLGIVKNIVFPEKNLKIFSTLYENLYNLSSSIAISLIILKGLFYGFKIYVLWKDGNPEENPLEIITRYLFALALMFCFKELYNIFGNIINDILIKVDEAFTTSKLEASSLNSVLGTAFGLIMGVVFIIVFLYQYCIALFSMLKKGIELFILRIGYPLACIDLINPQASTFNAYTSQLIKSFFSVIVMKLVLNLAIALAGEELSPVGMLWAIACLFMVNNTPAILSQFIVPSSGGGGGFIGSSVQMAGRSAMGSAMRKILTKGK